MLEVNQVNIFYGKIQALWDVSLVVHEGEIVSLVGANGAGKSTLINAISGVVRPTSGKVIFRSQPLDGLGPEEIVNFGVSQVPEGGRVFPDMTVHENLEMGAYPHRAWKQKEETLKQVYQIFPRLKERQGQLASTLSGGEKQMLAIGRCLMSKPKLCMFDEPSYGLAPVVVLEVFRIIRSLREQGITILLVEQNVGHALEIADRAYVLENGRVTLNGPASDLLNSDYVRRAYLGR